MSFQRNKDITSKIPCRQRNSLPSCKHVTCGQSRASSRQYTGLLLKQFHLSQPEWRLFVRSPVYLHSLLSITANWSCIWRRMVTGGDAPLILHFDASWTFRLRTLYSLYPLNMRLSRSQLSRAVLLLNDTSLASTVHRTPYRPAHCLHTKLCYFSNTR